MMEISKLQECLKAKKKISKLQTLFDVIKVIQTTDHLINLTLNQKGILLELLARVCLYQYELFSKIFNQYYDDLQGGVFGAKNKTTAKKKRITGEKGATTTAKRRKQNLELPRGIMNLNQMLDQQLSTPQNTQPRSHNSLQLSKKRIQFELGTIQKLQIPSLIQQQFVTPLKQQKEQQQQSKKLDQYRVLIQLPSKNKTKNKTKKQQGTTKTRKKTRQTQKLQDQINKDISLNLTTQISIRKQIQDILQVTKKKKIYQNQNFLFHELFSQNIQKENFNFQNKHLTRLFYRQNGHKLPKGTNLHDNHNSQNSDRLSTFGFTKNERYLEQNEYFMEQKAQQVLVKLEEKLHKQRKVQFSNFVSNLNLGKEDKSVFFYDMLCRPEKYKLQQSQTDQFGQIIISMIRNNR